jgi:hypothetical protein
MARKLQNLSHWTDSQLQIGWERGFEDRVKSGKNKGQITLRAAKLGDAILAESEKRGFRVNTPARFQ